jgi:type I restriction enzyme R subunit
MTLLRLTEANINEYGRFDKLKDTVDKRKARAYFENQKEAAVPPYKVNILVDALLRRFLIEGGFDLE